MMYVYVLQSKRVGFFYVGMTHDVPMRLRQHNKGQSRSTRGYRPWELFFYEEYPDVLSAHKRELYLKSASGREYIRKRWMAGSRKKLNPA